MPTLSIEPQDPLQVWECKALQKLGSAEALPLLQRIAKQVQPVMRKRGWRVPLLTEFSPKNPNLLGLNINGGGGKTSEIKIRLRPHNSNGSFFPYDHLIGTMLHELVHNVQGPHNAVFYKLLDEITEECEGFMAKGISGSGAGFDAPSVGRLGGRGPVPVHNPPSHKLKSLALKAAEARSKKQTVMSSGGRKVGGDLSLLKSLTPAQAAARAAERRAKDNVWCPCDHGTDIGYNSDDDVIVLEESQHPQQAPSTSQAQTVLNASSFRHKKQAADAVPKQQHENNADAIQADERQQGCGLLQPGAKSIVSRQHGDLQMKSSGQSVSAETQAPQAHTQRLQPQQQQQQQVGSTQQQAVRRNLRNTHAASSPVVKSADNNELVDLTLNEDDHEPVSKRVRGHKSKAGSTEAQQCKAIGRTIWSQDAQDHSVLATQWACSICTLLNADLSLQCAACGQTRPAGFEMAESSHHHCQFNANLAEPAKAATDIGSSWSCRFCSALNSHQATHCCACDQWQYSYGVPHASRPTV